MPTEEERKAQEAQENQEEVEKTETSEEELDDDDFIDSLLDPDDDEDPEKDKKESKGKDEEEDDSSSEDERRKNKNAEEARKRREAEAKKKKEQEEKEAKAKEEAEKKKKAEEEAKTKSESESEKDAEKEKKRSANEQKLGEQLTSFKRKYPDVDLAKLDNDKHFKRYIEGKLLGKKDFTSLYEEYVDMTSELTGTGKEIAKKNHQKAKASSGGAQGGSRTPQDIYSEAELQKASERLPFLPRREAEKVQAKLERSIEYYEKKS